MSLGRGADARVADPRHLLEETYEAIEAIDALGDGSDPDAVELFEEELGDVLCQVLFHATIAAEEGLFNLADVAGKLADKLVRRHPHVFAGAAASDVLGRWEQQKAEEKGRESLLDGIPSALPALALAAKYRRRKARTLASEAVNARSDRQRSRPRRFAELVAGRHGPGRRAPLSRSRSSRPISGVRPPRAATRRAAGVFRGRFVAQERATRDAGVARGRRSTRRTARNRRAVGDPGTHLDRWETEHLLHSSL